MTRLIHSYLSLYYGVKNNHILPNGVIRDLSLVFALSKKQLKYYIKGWVRKEYRGVDFNKCWDNIDYFYIEGLTRPLRTVWRPEIVNDLQNEFGIDAEAELSALFLQNIEIEMQNMLREMENVNHEARQIINNMQVIQPL